MPRGQGPLKHQLPHRWTVLLVPFLKILKNPRVGSKSPILPIILLFSLLQILEKLQRSMPFRLIPWKRPPKERRREKEIPNPTPLNQSLLNLVLMMVPNVNRSTHVLFVKETIILKIVHDDMKLVNFSKAPKGLWQFSKNHSHLNRPRWLNNLHHLYHLGPRFL